MSSYEKEQERLNKLMLECLTKEEEGEFLNDEDEDDNEEDILETQELHSDTEQEISDVEIEEQVPVAPPRGPVFIGKDKISKWSKHIPHSSRTRAENLITRLPRTKAANVTIDENLEAFCGKCSFRQYIPSKPNRYGPKVYALVDSKTYYTMNLEVYVGTQPNGPYTSDNSSYALVQRLVEPIRDSKRNITCDNWFTSIPLIRTLYNDYKLTFLGTIRKNKRELPPEISNPTTRPIGSSMFAYNDYITLVSYIPKKKKNVLLLSTLHHDDKTDRQTGKPEMIMDYNDTKGGVDTLDKMCAAYDCARNTRRWPIVIFYSILNIAGVNSMVLYNLHNVDKNMTGRKFMHLMSSELAENHQEIPQINNAVAPGPPNARGRCSYCDRRKNRPTRFSCITCGKFMCLEHLTPICLECHSE
ncbi:piggyBac transposable element-derived protein 4-like, partial [Anoplophora glabripennis]|uniref:piggyBac transposable element-derived protein 4-like n=1 Tax=Anoplophora glabripennis TaxID=217634 RepID=UPI000C782C2C